MSEGTLQGIAGVRVADGRQVFVEGAPPELEHGTPVEIRSAGHELEGLVSVAPRLIIWRDPEVTLGTFVRMIPSEPVDRAPTAEPPIALFLGDETAPSAARLNEMLNLARAETFRLDD
jgi:hypothetical protein